MNLFEKIFNYQIFSRLDNSETYMLTTHERSWLKDMLAQPAATQAFAPETLLKLQSLLAEDSSASQDLTEHLLQKARSVEKQVYHPLLRPLRRMILASEAGFLSFRLKNGQVRSEMRCLPYRLEYNMVKREWYLLWRQLRSRTIMTTKLANITQLTADENLITAELAAKLNQETAEILERRKEQAVIEVVPRYNMELSRILYAFSCFEKEIDYDAATDTYRIRLTYSNNESEYMLSKIRFLGLRVRIVENEKLKRRMLDSANKTIARYSCSDNLMNQSL